MLTSNLTQRIEAEIKDLESFVHGQAYMVSPELWASLDELNELLAWSKFEDSQKQAAIVAA